MAKRTKKPTETVHILNLVPSKGTERDWKFEDALNSRALGAVAALPQEKDLRQAWWTIGNQEDTGSCVGWASTDGVMRYHLVTAGKLPKNGRVSPRFTWMASKETDEYTTRPETVIEGSGTSLKAAMDICRKYGVVKEEMLPFHIATKMYVGDENVFFAAAAQYRASSYFNLVKNLNQWKTWLASNGPIMAGLNVDATWDSATATHGILDAFQPNTVRGGHAVCIVGFRKDGRFIIRNSIRNSWGTSWGDNGFAYASEAYINGAFFPESYGITL
jgi:C1A family cysteine protease